MSQSLREPVPAPRGDGARDEPIELVVGAEKIGVWLDESGIHFRQPGVRREGLIPWSTALAVSMLPDDAPRLGKLVIA